MALLQELNEAPGGDSFANLYAKYDLLTQTINSILGGGTAGQSLRKVDGTDFNFEFFKLNVKSYVVDDNSPHAITPNYTSSPINISISGTNHITISGAVVGANVSARIRLEILKGATVIKTVKFVTDNEGDTVNDATGFSYTFVDVGTGAYSAKFTNELPGATTATLQTYTLSAISIIE